MQFLAEALITIKKKPKTKDLDIDKHPELKNTFNDAISKCDNSIKLSDMDNYSKNKKPVKENKWLVETFFNKNRGLQTVKFNDEDKEHAESIMKSFAKDSSITHIDLDSIDDNGDSTNADYDKVMKEEDIWNF